MSEGERARNEYQELPCEAKLSALRNDVLGVCAKLEAYVELLRLAEEDKINQLQPESIVTLEKMEEAVDRIVNFVYMYTDL